MDKSTSLTQNQVVAAALDLLDERGLDAVTMRAVAERLGVQHNTIRWHAASKQRLLELMADEMLAQSGVLDVGTRWPDRLRGLCDWCRMRLLSHRDGARLIAGTVTARPNTLAYGEAVVETLLGAGFDPRSAAWAHWSLFYFILGITYEQQAGQTMESVLTPGAEADFPSLAVVREHLGIEHFDERFRFGIDMFIAGMERLLPH